MNAKEFQEVLRIAMPEPEALASLGIDQQSVQELRSRFALRERARPTAVGSTGSSLLDELFSRFDPSGVVVGPIQFASRPEQVGGHWLIGHVEADPLIFYSSSSEIAVEDLAKPGHVLWHCAESPQHFLDALAILVPRLARAMGDPSYTPGTDSVERCAIAAGGAHYGAFYEMIIG